MAVEQHGVGAGAGRLHEDDRRTTLEPHDLDAQSFDRPLAGPAPEELDRAVDMAVLAPLGVEHRRLRRNLDVLVERGTML